MSKLEQKIDDLIKRISKLETDIATLTGIIQSRIPRPTPQVDIYPMPTWPWRPAQSLTDKKMQGE